jgi:L-aminopeptidase/D-esterase-like protein
MPSPGRGQVSSLPNQRMDPIFEATVQATEEAIINALVAAPDDRPRRSQMLGLPRPRAVLKKYNRLAQ